ncbi:MAG: peptidase C39 family protein [Pseudomonas sp.]|nr:peptidase C39 family protein [Pseudomonas sp.]
MLQGLASFLPPKRWLAATAVALLLAGCGTSKPGPPIPGLADRVELGSVPFFRGEDNSGSSLALAGLMTAQGVPITPGLIEKSMHLPQEGEKLQASVQNAAREFGLVVYPLDASLPALFAQVAAGNPVLVRYADGRVWTEPRYAVLVGYDRYKQRVLLRSGNERRKVMSFSSFESAWKGSGSYAVLVQPPTRLPAQVDRQRWLAAAHELAQAGQEQAAARAVKAVGP